MVEHPYAWLSVLPPVIAIVLAIATRRVLISLLAGIFAGALLLTQGQPLEAVAATLQDHLWATLVHPDKLHVFVFTMLMGVMVGVVNRSGGMKGLVNVLTPLASTRRRGQFVTWVLGLFVFFDDYANTMLLGNTLRPLTDRLKISREKLAYLVDSTAAPVAGIVLISTWVAGEIGYVQDGLDKLDPSLGWKAFDLFVASIPYRFYVIWALLFVPMVALWGRDFGAMRTAELRARQGELHPAGTSQKTQVDPTAPEPETVARWYNAVIPVLVTVGATVYFLYVSGDPAPGKSLQTIFGDADPYGSLLWGALSGALISYVLIAPQRLIPFDEMVTAGANGAFKMLPALAILWLASALSNMTGNSPNDADGSQLEQATAVAAAVQRTSGQLEETAKQLYENETPLLVAVQAILELPDDQLDDQPLTRARLQHALFAGGYPIEDITPMMGRLNYEAFETSELASDSAATSSEAVPVEVAFAYRDYRLYTGDFLSELLGPWLAAAWMPTIVFVLAGFVAFSTGTSWGTMGIVMPLVIPLAYSALAAQNTDVSPNDPVLLGVIGAVLAGAIFGDHCSPISDTTVLSSQASGCDHIAHVRTQLPYALLVGVISIVCGTIPIGFGISVWFALPLGIGVMLASLWIFGRGTDEGA